MDPKPLCETPRQSRSFSEPQECAALMGASPACLDSLPPCEPGFTTLFPSLRKNPAERMSYLELMVSVHGKCLPCPLGFAVAGWGCPEEG